MRPTQFVDALGEKLFDPSDELTLVDRYITKRGLRTKAVGRTYPDLTTKEALRVVLAAMASRMPSHAVDDLLVVEKYRLYDTDFEEGTVADLQRVLGLSVEEIKNADLIDVLAAIARQVAAPWGAALERLVRVRVDYNGPVRLFVEGPGSRAELVFYEMDGRFIRLMGLTRSSTLDPKVFAWIGHATKDAEA